MRTLLVLIVTLLTTAAQARYAGGDGPYSAWFEAQHNCEGWKCCDISDGHPYYDDYKLNADGSVTLSGGQHVDKCGVLLSSRNPTGHAVLWTWRGKARCFAPGSGS